MHRIGRFAVVGLINTTIDVGVFALLVGTTGAVAFSNAIAYGCGAMTSYFLNRDWTFGHRSTRATHWCCSRAWRFAGLNLLSLCVSTVTVVLGAVVLPIAAAKILSVLLTAALTYSGMRYFVFTPDRS